MAVTAGSVEGILSGSLTAEDESPTLQIINCRKIESAGKADRYRVVASDGARWSQCMAASQLNGLVTSGRLEVGCLVTLNKFLCNSIQGRVIIILLEVSVVGGPVPQIGNPTSYPDGNPLPGAAASQGGAAGAAAPRGPASSAPSAGASAAPRHNARAPAAGAAPPKKAASSFGAAMRGAAGASGQFRAIADLNPYQQRFAIKARVTSKSAMRFWDKPTSKGNLFSVDLLDASGEIRGTFFKELADQLFPVLEEGKVYEFQETSARLKPSNKAYTSIPHEFEVTFSNCTAVECADDGSIAAIVGNWVKISSFADGNGPREGTVDVVAVVKQAFPVGTIVSKKSGKELTKREVTLVDDSGYDVRCTFWGDIASRDDAFWDAQPVLAAKGLRVSDFGGMSLGTSFGAQLAFDSDVDPESQRLKAWWNQGGRESASTPLTGGGGGGGGGTPAAFGDRVSIDSIKANQLGFGEKPDYVTFTGHLNFIKPDRMWYEAHGDGCQKKVIQNSDGTWTCEKCNANVENCDRRYLVTSTFIDDSGQAWISSFNEHATQFLGNVSANDLAAYKEEVENEDGKFEDYMRQFNFKQYHVKIRVKSEVWNEQTRVKSNIVAMTPLDGEELVRHSRCMIDAIHALG